MYVILLLRAFVLFPFFILLRLVSFNSKNSKIWVFSSWGGMRIADNPKYLYIDLKNIDKTIRSYFLLKDKYKCDGDEVVYYLSVKGLYLQSMADVCFFSHSILSDYFLLYIKFFPSYKVQMWHGSPYKKIMNDVPCSLFSKFKRIVFDKCDLYICANDFFKGIMIGAFDDKPCKFIASGLPRVRFDTNSYEKHSKNKKILYAPTFRDNEVFFSLFRRFSCDFNELDSLLKKNGATFHIRLHPSSKLNNSDVDSINKCTNIIIDESDDIYETLQSYDLIVTDYSSVVFDFYSYEKPIIFAPFDLDEYINTIRGSYFSYESYSVRPYAKDWRDLLALIEKKLLIEDNCELNKQRQKFGQELLGLDCSKYIYNEVMKRFYR